jgi:hypothetical protein
MVEIVKKFSLLFILLTSLSSCTYYKEHATTKVIDSTETFYEVYELVDKRHDRSPRYRTVNGKRKLVGYDDEYYLYYRDKNGINRYYTSSRYKYDRAKAIRVVYKHDTFHYKQDYTDFEYKGSKKLNVPYENVYEIDREIVEGDYR